MSVKAGLWTGPWTDCGLEYGLKFRLISMLLAATVEPVELRLQDQ